MTTMITVRDIDPVDKNWLKAEARRRGVSMEELVRCLIREKRAAGKREEKPSEIARRYFGPEHGLVLVRPKFKLRPKPVEFGE